MVKAVYLCANEGKESDSTGIKLGFWPSSVIFCDRNENNYKIQRQLFLLVRNRTQIIYKSYFSFAVIKKPWPRQHKSVSFALQVQRARVHDGSMEKQTKADV